MTSSAQGQHNRHQAEFGQEPPVDSSSEQLSERTLDSETCRKAYASNSAFAEAQLIAEISQQCVR